MKKVLLGVFALSAMAFAVSNPGDDSVSTTTKKYGEVGVPMEVRAEILPADARLILVDENNKKIEKLVFDHGKLIKSSSTPDSVVEKTVKLMLENGGPLGAHKVVFKARQSGVLVNKANQNKFVLNQYGTTDTNKLDSELVYNQAPIDTTAQQTEVSTQVISTIRSANIAAAESAIYIGEGTFEAAIGNNEKLAEMKK